MNATQAGNLRILTLHMEGLRRGLDMDSYFHSCGTPACAAGEACSVSALRANGLRTDERIPAFEYETGFGALLPFFGLNMDEALHLFGNCGGNAWRRTNVTPQEWAREARKVLAIHGYSMDEAKPIPSVAERLEAIYAGAKDLAEDYPDAAHEHMHPEYKRAFGER